MTSTADILRAAKAKIEDPARWCQGQPAKDAKGYQIATGSRLATAWCAWGACCSVAGVRDAGFGLALVNLNRVACRAGFGSAQELNDSSDHPTVMAMFDRAIELAEQEKKDG